LDKHQLFLITATFPYGLKSETFLEEEIVELSKRFNKITILPVSKTDGSNTEDQRPTPSNVEVDDALIRVYERNDDENLNKTSKLLKIKILLTEFLSMKYGKITFLKRLNQMWTYLNKDLAYYGVLKEFCDRSNNDVIIYNYWFVKTSISIALLKQQGFVKHWVSRAHGYDLYDDRWIYNLLPFRNYVAANLDRIYPISEYGRNYLIDKLNKNINISKITTSYLGVPSQSFLKIQSKKNEFVVVSVSSILDFKRVHEIPIILGLIKRPIKWVHFGDGPYMEKVKENSAKAANNLRIELKGHVSNQKVLEYFKNANIDLFLSLSLNEGLPVSIMEAMSFGIPTAAMEIKAMGELVTKKNGILIKTRYTQEQTAQAIEKVLTIDFDPFEIAEFQRKYFNSNKNYSKFSDTIIADLGK